MSTLDCHEQIPFTTLENVCLALNAFFKFRENKILMLKGPWGVGKSFFLREYIRDNMPTSGRDSILPDWVAYVSLFGCNSVQQLEERIAASILPSKSWGNPTRSTLAEVFHSVASNTRFSLLGVSFALPVHSLIWRLTKQKGVLIVLDDLERTGDGLNLSDVLGFASSLGEHSTEGVKIVIVCNTGRLVEFEADKLASLREKVIHAELLFNPSPDQLVEKYFFHPELKSTMAWCLRAITEGNIRIIERASKTVTAITQIFAGKDIQLSHEDKNAIVRLCVFYYRVGRSIPLSWYRGRSLDNIFSRNEPEPDADPARTLFRKLEVDWDEIGPVVIDWLSHGIVSEEVLHTAIASLSSKYWREGYRIKSREAYRVWTSNLVITDIRKIADPINQLLEEYCEVLPLEDVHRHSQFLATFGLDTSDYLLRHVRAWVPRMDVSQCDDYLQNLTNEQARQLVEARRNQLEVQRTPKDIIWGAIKNSSYRPEDMEYVASLDTNVIESWLRCEDDRETLIILREFMTWVHPNQNTEVSRAGRAISAAIRRISNDSPANEQRARLFNLLVPDVGQ